MEIKEMRPKIVWLPRGANPKIAKALNTSEKSVSQAINGREDTKLAQKIRYVAVKEYGGIVVTHYEEDVPDCKTYHNNGVMIQEFSNRVRIIVDFNTGIAGCYVDGDLKSKCQPVTIAEFMDYQKSVIEVANSLNK